MDAAEAFSKAFKHEDAEKALGKVETLVMTAKIGASAKSGTPPNKAEIDLMQRKQTIISALQLTVQPKGTLKNMMDKKIILP